jgi:hypothetical protein
MGAQNMMHEGVIKNAIEAMKVGCLAIIDFYGGK